jgi:hypothetical protein
VLNQAIDTVLAKDKDYQQWRADHPQSFVPRGVVRRRGGGRSAGGLPVQAMTVSG